MNGLANQRIFGCVFLCPNCAQLDLLLRFPLLLGVPTVLRLIGQYLQGEVRRE